MNPRSDGSCYNDLAQALRLTQAYDNSPRLLYDMDCYRVDMCVLMPAFGMTNEINMQLVENYPDSWRRNARWERCSKRRRCASAGALRRVWLGAPPGESTPCQPTLGKLLTGLDRRLSKLR